MLKILYSRFQQYIDQGLSYVQAGFRQGRRTRDQITKNPWTRGFKEHICFIDYTKAFDCVDHNKLWKILKEMGIPDHLTYLLRNLYAGQKATVRTGHEKTDWFQIGNPAYLTYMQSTSCEIQGWMKHKLESRLLGEISIISDMQMTPPLWQKAKN